jgi:hypothetical protein
MGAHCSVRPQDPAAAEEAQRLLPAVEAVEAALIDDNGEVPSLAKLCIRTLCAHVGVLDLPDGMPQEVNDAVLEYLCKVGALVALLVGVLGVHQPVGGVLTSRWLADDSECRRGRCRARAWTSSANSR